MPKTIAFGSTGIEVIHLQGLLNANPTLLPFNFATMSVSGAGADYRSLKESLITMPIDRLTSSTSWQVFGSKFQKRNGRSLTTERSVGLCETSAANWGSLAKA